MWSVFAILSVIVFANAELIEHIPCLNEEYYRHGQNFSTSVSGCKGSDACRLIKNTTHTVNITFTPTTSSTGVVVQKVHGVFNSMFEVPYGVPSKVCETATRSDGSPCNSTEDFKANETYNFVSSFSVKSWFPSIKLQVRFSICDYDVNDTHYAEHSNCFYCALVPVQISNALTSEEEEDYE